MTDSMPCIQEIQEIREHGNFQTIKKKLGEAKLKNILMSLYPEYTLLQIEKMTGIPDSTLGRWFELLEIPLERWHIEAVSEAGSKDSESIIKHGKTIKRKYIVEITPDLAYLIGFCLGDGSTQKYTVEVFNKDSGLRQHLYSILKNYGPVGEKGVRTNGLWVLRLNSIRITNLIKTGKNINKKTINYIFKNDMLARNFISGFWDAEGRVAVAKVKYFDIYLYNTNKYLIDKVGRFLKRKKIAYSIFLRDDKERKYELKGRPVISRKVLYRISVHKKSYLTWAEEIGVFMMQSKKKQTVSEIILSLKT